MRGSASDGQLLFCAIRKTWVAALPEEIVRQRVLTHMVEQKGYPAPLVTVEQQLRQLPHLTPSEKARVPNRRADIIAFAKGEWHGFLLHPLIVIECKAVKLCQRVLGQVAGYHHLIRSPYIAVANQECICTGWYDAEKRDYAFVDRLLSYGDLLKTMVASDNA